MWATATEARDRWLAATCPRRPADRDDVRFEITSIIEQTEDPQMATLVETIDDRGEVVARDVFASYDDPYLMVEAYREAQAFSLEERFEMYAEAEERERCGAR